MKHLFTFLFIILCLAIALGVSWILTCALIYFVTLCFSLTFSWRIATGIWLILFLVSSFFKSGHSSKK